MKRRDILKLAGAGLAVWHIPGLAIEKPASSKKIIWIMLRGAMDSLHAVVPSFDVHLSKHRADLVNPIADKLLPLDRGFGLHPDLRFFHSLYLKKQFSPVVAVATHYHDRSHFDAQDILESGKRPVDHESGWLARAVAQYQGEGLAVSRSVPISLRGAGSVRSWYPSNLPDSDDDIYRNLMTLYKGDAHLTKRLEEAVDTQNMVGDLKTKRRPKLPELARACAKLLKTDGGPNCAMMDTGGWDTHNNLVNRLSRQFQQLDLAMSNLHEELGNTWRDTLVIIGTEFGRTVAVNGTRGTDHGTASALFFAGGNINGGKVLGDWPGLAKENLHEGRDLMPTSSSWDWIGKHIKNHWQLSQSQMDMIFPEI